MEAAVVKITIRDGLNGPVVYENISGVSGAQSYSWYDYFFNDPLLKRTQVIFSNIPPYLNAHIQEELDKVEFDDYSILATQYGPEAIRETYKCNPSTGYGFVEYVGPNGETGARDLPINTFASSKVNWGNRTVTTAGGQTYNIEEYDGEVPNKAEWDRLFDGANTLGQKR
jgi:hypothetical protein